MAQRKPITLRLDPAAVELLNAWAEHRHATGAAKWVDKGAVVEAMLRRVVPPIDLSPTAAAVRTAHAHYTRDGAVTPSVLQRRHDQPRSD